MRGDIEELVESLADEAGTVKPAPHPLRLSLAWIVAAAVYLATALALSGLRPDLLQKLHNPWFVAELACLLGIFVATAVSAALLVFPDLHQQRALAWSPAGLFAVFPVVLYLAWHADNPPAPLPVHSYQCTVDIALVMLLPAAWTLYAMRHSASTHYRLAGAIALLSAFSVGSLWLRLHEANDSVLHVIQWHYLPMLGLGLLGLWLGQRLLKW